MEKHSSMNISVDQVLSFLGGIWWVLCAIAGLLAILGRMGYKDLIHTVEEVVVKKLNEFTLQTQADIHAIKNQVTNRDGLLLQVMEHMAVGNALMLEVNKTLIQFTKPRS